MEFLPIIVAILGSTGVIGVLTGAIQFSRRARLSRAIRENLKAAEAVGLNADARMVIQQAIDTDALRLAAMSIIALRPTFWYFFWGIVISVATGAAMAIVARLIGLELSIFRFGLEQDALGKQWLYFISGISLAYVALGVLAVNLALQRTRERLVAAAMVAANPVITTRTMALDATAGRHHIDINIPVREANRSPARKRARIFRIFSRRHRAR